MSEFVTVAKVSDIPPGRGEAFPVAGRMVAVFNDNGTICAIDDFCPHMGASLATGDVHNSVVACPWHAWRFNVRTGTWCDNPKVKINRYAVQVVGDEIQVCGTPLPADEAKK